MKKFLSKGAPKNLTLNKEKREARLGFEQEEERISKLQDRINWLVKEVGDHLENNDKVIQESQAKIAKSEEAVSNNDLNARSLRVDVFSAIEEQETEIACLEEKLKAYCESVSHQDMRIYDLERSEISLKKSVEELKDLHHLSSTAPLIHMMTAHGKAELKPEWDKLDKQPAPEKPLHVRVHEIVHPEDRIIYSPIEGKWLCREFVGSSHSDFHPIPAYSEDDALTIRTLIEYCKKIHLHYGIGYSFTSNSYWCWIGGSSRLTTYDKTQSLSICNEIIAHAKAQKEKP